MSKILVIEDEQTLVGALIRGLTAEGFTVQTATNGADGYQLARENEYDLILLDVLLPGMNGFQICEALRKQGNQTPILMITGEREFALFT